MGGQQMPVLQSADHPADPGGAAVPVRLFTEYFDFSFIICSSFSKHVFVQQAEGPCSRQYRMAIRLGRTIWSQIGCVSDWRVRWASPLGFATFFAKDVKLIRTTCLQGDGSINGGDAMLLPDAIKLGLGDFIFYSVLVGRAAMYDMLTAYMGEQLGICTVFDACF